MGIKKYNPYTPSRRHMTGSDFSEITKTTPEKSLISATMNKQAGRNNQGKITVRHRGGGAKRKYRIIDFKRNSKDGIPATAVLIPLTPAFMERPMVDFMARRKETRFSNCCAMDSATN